MQVNSLISGTDGAAAKSQAKLATDFDQFLLLLTAQLQNQDPLDPLNSNEFVQQLVSFTGVEQSIAINSNLENLIGLFKSGQTASAVSYLGTTIEATGNKIALSNSAASFSYTLLESAATTSIVIMNENNDVAFVGQGNITAGLHVFEWDGLDANGNPQPDGIYKVTVSGFDSDDTLLTIPTVISGRVTKVDTTDDGIQLTVNGISVPIEEVRSVAESPTLVPSRVGPTPRAQAGLPAMRREYSCSLRRYFECPHRSQ